MEKEVKLTITIENQQPIELIELARSMASFADEYRAFLADTNSAAHAEHTKLYVKEIRQGSIIQELIAVAPAMMPLFEHADTIIEYGKHLKAAYDFLAGKGDKPANLNRNALQRLINIVQPVATDNGSNLVVTGNTINGDLVVNLTINSLEANAVQNSARRQIELLKEPVTGDHQGVVIYWAQAKNATVPARTDKAIVESIATHEVMVKFASEDLKRKMLLGEGNPFTHAFVVDLKVETIDGRPALYTVQAVHDVIER